MLQGLRIKFIAIILCALGIVFAVITFFLVAFASNTLRQDLNQNTQAFSSLATPQIGQTFNVFQSSGLLRIQQEVNNYIRLNSNLVNVRIVSNDNSVVYNHNPSSDQPLLLQNTATHEPQYFFTSDGVISQAIIPFEESSGIRRYAVVYDISTSNINARIAQIKGFVMLFGLVAVLATASGVVLFTNHYILYPIHALSIWSKKISRGKYDEEPPISKPADEVGELSQTVQGMAERLKSDIYKLEDIDKLKSEFMMITSHNLRTPLTELKGAVEFLETLENLPPETNTFIGILNKGTQRLGLFTEVMLTVARIESGQVGTKNDTPVKINEIVSKIKEEFNQDITAKQLSFKHSLPESPNSVAVNEEFLKILLRCLMDNAIKFTPNKGTISLAMRTSNQQLHIEVADSGVGISPEEQAKLFTKFHRGTSTVQYNYEGTGLGLYLVKLIANLYQGSVAVDSTPNKGTTVRITLPLHA